MKRPTDPELQKKKEEREKEKERERKEEREQEKVRKFIEYFEAKEKQKDLVIILGDTGFKTLKELAQFIAPAEFEFAGFPAGFQPTKPPYDFIEKKLAGTALVDYYKSWLFPRRKNRSWFYTYIITDICKAYNIERLTSEKFLNEQNRADLLKSIDCQLTKKWRKALDDYLPPKKGSRSS